MTTYRYLGPGVYEDGAGGLHLDVAELLLANGYPDTPANRAMITEAAYEQLRTRYPTVAIDVTDTPIPRRES